MYRIGATGAVGAMLVVGFVTLAATYCENLWFERRDGVDGYFDEVLDNARVARRDRVDVPHEAMCSKCWRDPGETFSRERLTESTKAMTERLGDEGYAFANVNAVPEIDKEKRTASFTFFVDPGRRVYVRRVNVAGNTRTRDEVIRREMRQFEGGWYNAEALTRSRRRVDRLGYFSEVNIETPAVPGANDQVDVNVSVVVRSTGNLLFGAQPLGKCRQDATGQRNIARFDSDVGHARKRLNDGQKRDGRQSRCLIGVGVDNGRIVHNGHFSGSVFLH
jgi:hypothetical protein